MDHINISRDVLATLIHRACFDARLITSVGHTRPIPADVTEAINALGRWTTTVENGTEVSVGAFRCCPLTHALGGESAAMEVSTDVYQIAAAFDRNVDRWAEDHSLPFPRTLVVVA